MREGAKRRLAGAVAVVALAVIFVPMLFEEKSLAPPPNQTALPLVPDFAEPAGAEFAEPLNDATLPPPNEETDADLPIDSALPPLSTFSGSDDAFPDGEPAGSNQPAAPARDLPSGQPGQLNRAPSKPSTAAPSKETAAANPSKPKPSDDKMSSWVIQVASLGTAQTAAALEKKLRAAGFSAFVEQAEVRGKQYYRVRVGPEMDRASAERAATKLRQQQKLETLIQRSP